MSDTTFLVEFRAPDQSSDTRAMAFSPDGKSLVSTYGNDLQIWNVATQEPIGIPVKGHKGQISSVAFDQSGRSFASASDDGTVRVWDAVTGAPLGEPLRGHEYGVEDLAFSPDGTTLASASFDTNVLLWDVNRSDNLTISTDEIPEHDRVKSIACSTGSTQKGLYWVHLILTGRCNYGTQSQVPR